MPWPPNIARAVTEPTAERTPRQVVTKEWVTCSQCGDLSVASPQQRQQQLKGRAPEFSKPRSVRAIPPSQQLRRESRQRPARAPLVAAQASPSPGCPNRFGLESVPPSRHSRRGGTCPRLGGRSSTLVGPEPMAPSNYGPRCPGGEPGRWGSVRTWHLGARWQYHPRNPTRLSRYGVGGFRRALVGPRDRC